MKKILLLLAAVLCLSFGLLANPHYKLYAGFIYHFAKFTQFPSDKQSGDFVIGVLGSKDMAAATKALASSKTIGNRKIVVHQFNNTSEIKNCHILFVANNKKGDISKVTSLANNKKFLVITETPDATSQGSTINFVEANGKVKFELSRSAAVSQGLKISSELQKLAIIKA